MAHPFAVLDLQETIQEVHDSMLSAGNMDGNLVSLGRQDNGLVVNSRSENKTRYHMPFGKSAHFQKTALTSPLIVPHESPELSVISNAPKDKVSLQSVSTEQKYYPIAQVAEQLGTYAQYIRTLVDRFDGFLTPKRFANAGSRETYFFSEEDVAKIANVDYLVKRGRTLREAVSMTRHEKIHQQIADELLQELKEQAQETSYPDGQINEGWVDIVAILAKIPTLSENQRQLLIQIEGYERTLAECVSILKLESEAEARGLLADVYVQAGAVIFEVLRLGYQKKPRKVE